VLNKS